MLLFTHCHLVITGPVLQASCHAPALTTVSLSLNVQLSGAVSLFHTTPVIMHPAVVGPCSPQPIFGHFFGVPKKPARAARGARSAPEGRREAPRSGAGCRAAAQSAAAGG